MLIKLTKEDKKYLKYQDSGFLVYADNFGGYTLVPFINEEDKDDILKREAVEAEDTLHNDPYTIVGSFIELKKSEYTINGDFIEINHPLVV